MFESMGGKPAGGRWNRVLAACLCAALGLFAGCEDVEWNWGLQPGPQPRPAGRPVGRVVPQSDASASRPEESSPVAAPSATPGTTAAQPAPAPSPSHLHVYQLILFSEAGPATAPPGLKYIRLQHARARDVANVLILLYLPSGPSGTDHRFTLLYPTPLEIESAAEAARQLDVGTAGTAPAGATAGDSWRWGVAEAFAVLEDPTCPSDRVRRAADALAVAINSSQLPKLTRWMGGMIAGELLAHRVYDYAAAEAIYGQTEATVEPGSYEQMSLLYARARALRQDGRPEPARRLFEMILGQFTAMRGSEVFERTREVLGQWDRRR